MGAINSNITDEGYREQKEENDHSLSGRVARKTKESQTQNELETKNPCLRGKEQHGDFRLVEIQYTNNLLVLYVYVGYKNGLLTMSIQQFTNPQQNTLSIEFLGTH